MFDIYVIKNNTIVFYNSTIGRLYRSVDLAPFINHRKTYFVLTDERGKKYCHARQFTNTTTTLTFVVMSENNHFKWLNCILKRIIYSTNIHQAIADVKMVAQMKENSNQSPIYQSLPFKLTHLWNALSITTFVTLVPYILCEQKIVFIAQDVHSLVKIIESIMTLLYPFEWLHTYIPYFPSTIMDVHDIINSPVPFIIGINCADVDCNRLEKYISDLVVVDLDQDIIQTSLDISLPITIYNTMVHQLEEYRSSNTKAPLICITEIYTIFCNCFKCKYIVGEWSYLNKYLFLQQHKDLFYEFFVSTQYFLSIEQQSHHVDIIQSWKHIISQTQTIIYSYIKSKPSPKSPQWIIDKWADLSVYGKYCIRPYSNPEQQRVDKHQSICLFTKPKSIHYLYQHIFIIPFLEYSKITNCKTIPYNCFFEIMRINESLTRKQCQDIYDGLSAYSQSAILDINTVVTFMYSLIYIKHSRSLGKLSKDFPPTLSPSSPSSTLIDLLCSSYSFLCTTKYTMPQDMPCESFTSDRIRYNSDAIPTSGLHSNILHTNTTASIYSPPSISSPTSIIASSTSLTNTINQSVTTIINEAYDILGRSWTIVINNISHKCVRMYVTISTIIFIQDRTYILELLPLQIREIKIENNYLTIICENLNSIQLICNADESLTHVEQFLWFMCKSELSETTFYNTMISLYLTHFIQLSQHMLRVISSETFDLIELHRLQSFQADVIILDIQCVILIVNEWTNGRVIVHSNNIVIHTKITKHLLHQYCGIYCCRKDVPTLLLNNIPLHEPLYESPREVKCHAIEHTLMLHKTLMNFNQHQMNKT